MLRLINKIKNYSKYKINKPITVFDEVSKNFYKIEYSNLKVSKAALKT